MSCHTDSSEPTAPLANDSDRFTASSMPGMPWNSAVRPETEATGPTRDSRMSTSWMLCSSRAPDPARATSPRQVDLYMPCKRDVLVVAEEHAHDPTAGRIGDQLP